MLAIPEQLSEFCSMHHVAIPSSLVTVKTRVDVLEKQFIWFAFFNLLLVSLIGLFLRSLPFISVPVNFKYVLHAHSHFAFGGWVMPVLTYLIMHYFPSVKQKVDFKHWRNIFIMLLFSAYGMLFTFPVEGYAAGSIIFSTISIGAGVYLSVCVFKGLKGEKNYYSNKFLFAGMVYLLFSSLGPFATGPIAAIAGKESVWFNDAIYYFLHFQYNGFFSFVVLAVLYKLIEIEIPNNNNGRQVFILFNLACVPTYFLSILWHHPGMIFNLLGGIGAALQLIAIVFLLKDFFKMKSLPLWVRQIIGLAIIGLIIKVALQLASAIPTVADLAYMHRNFVIAYLHLVLLGFISLFAMATVFNSKPSLINTVTKTGIITFVISLLTTNTLLVLEALGEWMNFYIPHILAWLWIFTFLFPISITLILISISPSKQRVSERQKKAALA